MTEILIFSLILLFFLFPPIYSSFTNVNSTTVLEWKMPILNAIYALFALVIYIEYNDKIEEKNAFNFVYKKVVPFTLCFGFLLTFSLIYKFIAILISHSSSTQIIFPTTFIKWIYCILSFFFAAFFEEVLYRFYTPEIIKYFVRKIKNEKVIFLISEIITILFFSLAHYYMGYLSVINALTGHIILRLCYKKSNSIMPGFLAHFLYNIISLILL